MRCLCCGRFSKVKRDLCDNCYHQVWTAELVAIDQARRRAKVAALREARKTMTDGQLADAIVERWRSR